MGSDVEMESEEEREERKMKEKRRDRSRSRSKDKDKKKHKKHKKEKKRHRKRDRDSDEGGDTANEGGDTPEKAKAKEATPEADNEDGEIQEKKERRKEYNRDSPEKRHDRKEYNRDRDDGDRRRRRSRSRSRDRHRDRSGSKERKEGRENYKREEKRERNGDSEASKEASKSGPIQPEEGGDVEKGNAVMSLSIEETNKLRAKLGLKPLNVEKKDEVDEHSDQPGVLIPGDRDKTRHLAPEHWGQRDKAKKLREKLATNRDKRTQNNKLRVVKGLGESDSEDDDASKWIERQKNKTKLKEEAEKRAKAMQQLDDEFGVGDIVEEGIKNKRQQEYSSNSLKGLRVEHSSEAFSEKTTVLTLKDQDILDDGYEDVLVNVNVVDDERTKKSLQNIKDGKVGYNAYGDEEVDELTGETKKKNLLYQYNEEIDGVKKDGFTLESEGQYSEEQNRERELAKIRTKLKLQNAISLETPDMKVASDYYTEQEMTAFKKPKKKKKVKKKMLKADDLLAMIDGDVNETGDIIAEKQKKRASRIIDDDIALPDGRLPTNDENFTLDPEPEMKSLAALKVASKLKKFKTVEKVAEEILQERNDDMDIDMDEEEMDKNDLIIDQTTEFCRGLTEVSYSKSGLVESVDQGLLDFEKQLESKRLLERSKMEDEAEKREIERKESKKSKRGTWEEVDHEVVESGKWKEGARDKRRRRDKDGKSSSSKDISDGGGKSSFRPSILDDEAMASTGMGAALKLAGLKGYLDQEEKQNRSTGLVHLKCQNYNIEDKSRDHEEDDRKRRGGRGGDRGYSGGPTQTFSEKKGYKPSVNLEYIDDTGRSMNQKEAFRFLSHKFHGKGSGKLKTEKRHRKVQEEKLMDKMSSTDTPLNTLSKLQSKTKEMATPYVLLSGNKLDATSLKK